MEPARHLEILRREMGLLAAVDPAMLDAPVPTLEDWDVERVVRHVGKVHRWVLGMLELGPDQGMDDAPPVEPMPKGPDCLPAYREAADALLARLATDDPARTCLNFAGVGTVAFWMRRQAQEVSVHRVDAQDAIHAAGGGAPDALSADGAADGIDEWARFFLAVRWGQRFGQLPEDLIGRTVHIHGTDDPASPDGAEWLLTFAADRVEVAATHAKGDVALRGPADDLLLALWRRRPLGSIDVIGDRALAERLLEVARF
ncbi:maleylpyruvate isomerase N-terminal domain-containing protein [Aquihabitans daechungensis]|uniref:maleylpyruvate isomerase N-terminal domain-containing protein n=1 Tax=Aquihabitans daechungensis TaxID=1052257 RepID=UPI003BA37812